MNRLNDTKYIISQQESLQRVFKQFNDAALMAEEVFRGFISASKRFKKFKSKRRNNAYCR